MSRASHDTELGPQVTLKSTYSTISLWEWLNSWQQMEPDSISYLGLNSTEDITQIQGVLGSSMKRDTTPLKLELWALANREPLNQLKLKFKASSLFTINQELHTYQNSLNYLSDSAKFQSLLLSLIKTHSDQIGVPKLRRLKTRSRNQLSISRLKKNTERHFSLNWHLCLGQQPTSWVSHM